jgi:hypothetical protein
MQKFGGTECMRACENMVKLGAPTSIQMTERDEE